MQGTSPNIPLPSIELDASDIDSDSGNEIKIESRRSTPHSMRLGRRSLRGLYTPRDLYSLYAASSCLRTGSFPPTPIRVYSHSSSSVTPSSRFPPRRKQSRERSTFSTRVRSPSTSLTRSEAYEADMIISKSRQSWEVGFRRFQKRRLESEKEEEKEQERESKRAKNRNLPIVIDDDEEVIVIDYD